MKKRTMELFGAFVLGSAATLAFVCMVGMSKKTDTTSDTDNIDTLEKAMHAAAEAEDYKAAISFRDKINNLKSKSVN